MPDTPLPTTKQKMALTEKERQLIMDYRAKTEVNRSFNLGLDHAIQQIPLIPDEAKTYTYDEVDHMMASLRFNINKARQDV